MISKKKSSLLIWSMIPTYVLKLKFRQRAAGQFKEVEKAIVPPALPFSVAPAASDIDIIATSSDIVLDFIEKK